MLIHATTVERSTTVKLYYTMVAIHILNKILFTLPFMQCEVQSGYPERACLFIDHIISTSAETTCHCEITSYRNCSHSNSYVLPTHAHLLELLLIDMDRNCTYQNKFESMYGTVLLQSKTRVLSTRMFLASQLVSRP